MLSWPQDFTTNFQFFLRWVHFLAGITWIGLLYYFNLVQVPFFAETEAPVRTGAIQKLVPRALWWFRWGAMVTFLAGWLYLLIRAHQLKGGFFAGSYGWAILLGGILGSVMWANVWFVIIVVICRLETSSRMFSDSGSENGPVPA